MQQNKLNYLSALLLSALLAGCTSVQPTQHELKEHVEHTADGFVKLRYTYYLDQRGNEVLHGVMERWEAFGSFGTKLVYRDGQLIEKSRIGATWTPDPKRDK